MSNAESEKLEQYLSMVRKILAERGHCESFIDGYLEPIRKEFIWFHRNGLMGRIHHVSH